jgi:hypothetical protein
MAYIDTLTMYNELIASGCTEKVARTIVMIINEERREFQSKIESLNDKLNRR